MAESDQPAGVAVDRGVRALSLTAEELHELPKEVLRSLTGETLRKFAVQMRGQRNVYHNLWQAQTDKAERLQAELDEARGACRRLTEAVRRLSERGTAFSPCVLHRGHSYTMDMQVCSAPPMRVVCPVCAGIARDVRPNVQGAAQPARTVKD